MSRQPINSRQAEVLAALSEHPEGASCADLANRFQVDHVLMAQALRRLRLRGEVAVALAGVFSLWCLPGHLKATTQRLKREQAERDSARQKARYAKWLAMQAAPSLTPDPDEDRDDPLLFKKPRIVPASIHDIGDAWLGAQTRAGFVAATAVITRVAESGVWCDIPADRRSDVIRALNQLGS